MPSARGTIGSGDRRRFWRCGDRHGGLRALKRVVAVGEESIEIRREMLDSGSGFRL